MQQWNWPAEDGPGWGSTVVALDLGAGSGDFAGDFDGVLAGQEAVIRRAVAAARADDDGARSVVVRWGVPAGPRLTTGDRAAELVAALGADGLCTGAADHPDDLLIEHLRASRLVVDRVTEPLADLATRYELAVEVVAGGPAPGSDPLRDVLDGEVERAATTIGRPHRVTGVVVRGDQRGRELGFPTANLDAPAELAIPADGVYAGRLVRRLAGAELQLPAAISVGTNPTFAGERARRVEAYVLDFDGDLYDEPVSVDFTARLRPTVAFDSVDALIEQMHADVAAVRDRLA